NDLLNITTPTAAYIEASPYRARASRPRLSPSSTEEGSNFTMWPVRVCLLISMLAAGAMSALAQHEATESEIEAGKQQYATNCTRCHGPDGDNIADADIGHGKFRRASTDA